MSGRRLKVHPGGEVNPMAGWTRLVNPWRAALNFLVLYLCRFLPWVGVKRFLYRSLGMKVGRNVAVGLGAMFDIFFPHLISLGDNCVIGYNATILAHEFLVREWRTGPVEVGRDVLIGANATVLPGVRIGDGAVVGAGAVVTRDVPPGAFVAGVPAREVRPPAGPAPGAGHPRVLAVGEGGPAGPEPGCRGPGGAGGVAAVPGEAGMGKGRDGSWT